MGGAFHLVPRERVTEILRYCLAHAAAQTNVRIHCAQFLSNHFHLELTDPDERVSEFMARLDSLSARMLNTVLGRRGSVWENQQFSAVRVFGADTALDKMVYTLTNVVAAHLVREHRRWPGLTSTPDDVGRFQWVDRPSCFSRRSCLPKRVKLEFTKPPGFEDFDDAQFRTLLERAVAAREEELRQAAKAQGIRFRSRAEILGCDPTTTAPYPSPKGALNPKIACSDPEWLKELLDELQHFYSSYREALREFCSGVRDVIFPCGTYWLRVHYGVKCAPAPT